MESWNIDFDIGLGPLKLGNSQAEAAASHPEVGAAKDVDVQPDGTVKEFRSLEIPILTFQDRRLIEIQADRYCERVTIFDTPVFQYPVRKLTERHPNTRV